MVPWYYGTNMQNISTNIRFRADEYEELKRFAFLAKKSIASVIRDAVSYYKEEILHSDANNRKALFNLVTKSAVTIKTPVVDLVREGRKFE